MIGDRRGATILTRSSRPSKRPDDSPSKPVKTGGLNLKEKLTQFQDWLAERRKLAVVEPEHIEPGKRIMAIGIDFGAAYLVGVVVMMIPLVSSILNINLVMLSLLCVRDYFYSGRGLGKNIMGFKVVDIFTGQAPTIKAVLVRNLVYLGPLLLLEALHLLLKILPGQEVNLLLGPLYALATLYVLVILPLECYRSYRREDSMRLGDEIAGTCLLDSETSFDGFLPK